jgi:hypothetical protein
MLRGFGTGFLIASTVLNTASRHEGAGWVGAFVYPFKV